MVGVTMPAMCCVPYPGFIIQAEETTCGYK